MDNTGNIIISAILIFSLVLTAFFVVMCVSAFQSVNAYSTPNYYPTCGIIVETTPSENMATFKDNNGNLWDFYTSDNYNIGDLVAVVMNGVSTLEITDDEVVSVRLCNFPTKNGVQFTGPLKQEQRDRGETTW